MNISALCYLPERQVLLAGSTSLLMWSLNPTAISHDEIATSEDTVMVDELGVRSVLPTATTLMGDMINCIQQISKDHVLIGCD